MKFYSGLMRKALKKQKEFESLSNDELAISKNIDIFIKAEITKNKAKCHILEFLN